MTEKETRLGRAADLRKQAEEMVQEKASLSPENMEAMSPAEMRKTLHELHVHQIELTMQNEELRRTQAELDISLARYFDLYNLAPVGYLTLSQDGLILEGNFNAANLFDLPQSELCKQPLTSFIIKEDQDIYYLHRKKLLETGAPQTCELRMVKKDKAAFFAHLLATAAQDAEGEPVCRVVLSDISRRKEMESQREAMHEEIRKLNADLEQRIKERTVELQKTIAQLEELNHVFVGRELRMIELKARIAELEKKM